MSDETIKIGVLIPVYNAEKYLEKCLDSIIGQTYSNWEAIIIDDASTDNSFNIMSRYAERDNRIKVYSHKKNKGPGYTRNEAISNYISMRDSETDNSLSYIVFVDSDDWVEDGYFKNISEIAKKEGSDVIFVDLIQEDTKGQFIKTERMSDYKGKPKDTIIRHQMTGKLPWGGVRKAVKTDLIVGNNIKYSNVAIGEEALYSFKLLYSANKISFIDKGLYHYVIHPGSQSGKHDEDPYGPICYQIKEYLYEINEYEFYKKTLASFAFTAFIVSVYRRANYYDLKKALKLSRVELGKFKSSFGFKLDKNSLESRVLMVLPIAKVNLVFPIVILAKIKNLLGRSEN